MHLIKFALKFLDVAVTSSQNGYFVTYAIVSPLILKLFVHTTNKISHILFCILFKLC